MVSDIDGMYILFFTHPSNLDTTVSLHTKLRLVKLYRHMHQDMSMTRRVNRTWVGVIS